MSRVRILPEILANKIAAGEVVERPASVVKELLENALDAGCGRVLVEVEKGGRSLIRVSDDGCGMNRDDALLATERYATSKLQDEQSLFAIPSLGFRGEALPSIAAVSQFTLVTRDVSSDTAAEVVIHGGTLKNVGSVGAPVGTLVAVRQLFYNTPARRKFMKTVNTEMGHIYDTVAGLALGWPKVQFRLNHNGRGVKQWSAAKPFERAVDVLGKDLQRDLFPLEGGASGAAVSGWISSPRVRRSSNRSIYLFVNGRRVRDRIVQQALFRGYAQRLVKGQFPVAVIHLQIPWDAVDVNVHPAKHEVRFAEQKGVYEAVAGAVAAALQERDRPAWQPAPAKPPRAAETPAVFSARPPRNNPLPLPDPPLPVVSETPAGAPPAEVQPLSTPPEDPWGEGFFAHLRVIGQLRNTYLVCESDDYGLLLVDQHAAHERIVFERLKRSAQGARGNAQKLLLPETVDFNFKDAQVLTAVLPDLNRLGLEIEPFGGQTFAVKAVPTFLENREILPLLEEIIAQLSATGVSGGLADALDDVLILMACHSAVRGHQALGEAEIKALLRQLDGCENPSHCPHGRPTWIHWTPAALEKLFHRTG